MSIKDWPKGERPREKLLHQGAKALTDAELLAIFIRTGIKGMSAVSLARQLLKEAGGLRAFLNLSSKQTCAYRGVGLAKYVQFQAALEVGRRYLLETFDKGEVMSSPQACKRYLSLCLRDKPHEEFYVLFLDSKHQVIHHGSLFRGTIDSASVPIREVVKEALAYNAAALIVAHNHPSGVCEPSQSDIQLTESLKSALMLIGIKLLDHFIVGESQVISLAEAGYMI